MNIVISRVEDIKRYNPYVYLRGSFDDEYFEDKFIEYLDEFRIQVEKLKERLSHKEDKLIDRLVLEIIKKRNDEIIDEIIESYHDNNNKDKNNLKDKIRIVKNMILVSEPANMNRLLRIDKRVDDIIDRVCIDLDYSEINDKLIKTIDEFNPSSIETLKDYSDYVLEFKSKINDIYNSYRNVFSVSYAAKKIKKAKIRVEKTLDLNAYALNYYGKALKEIDLLVNKYKDRVIYIKIYNGWVDDFRHDIDSLTELFKNCFSKSMATELMKILNKKTGSLLDELLFYFGMDRRTNEEFEGILSSYNPGDIDLFDVVFYSDEEERDKACEEYKGMTDEEKLVFETRVYEQYIRLFKGKIKDYNKNIRRIYSTNKANKIVNSSNRKADKLICDVAKKIGKPVPKNPWFIRRYLWADTSNFISDGGVVFRKVINPVLRNVVRFAMKNKLIIEERGKLDPTKQYIFVSTHYFTEDVIGLFSSIGRQAYMLMGTTDQIENNPLMAAAACFGFFHLDRMDDVSRKECVEKQNKIIEHGTNFINYVSGSWQTSENELQPLSFSGPYRTAKKMNVEIVPVASYLVKEKKEMYVRYGEPIDISMYSEEDGNELIRDTLASMHYKQISKHGSSIETIEIKGYGKTHNLPYNQHIYYMDQIGNEYWNQPWSKPFAKEEIGVRTRKEDSIEDVYSFVDNLSRESLIKLSGSLSGMMVRRYQRDNRYNIIKYIDSNYNRFKNDNCKKKIRKK